MIYFVIGLMLGFALGMNSKQRDPVDYSQLDQKLRSDLAVAENLNNSLKKDLAEAKETIWKLKQE